MDLRRRTVIAGTGAIAAMSIADLSAAKTPESPWAAALTADGNTIKAVHVTSGPDGRSKLEDIDIAADQSVAPKLFQQFLTHKASRVAIYQAPPHHAIVESEPAKDLLLIVDGTTTIKTDSGSRTLGQGSFVLFDGVATHAQNAGPTGYVAIKVRLAE